MTVRRIAHHAVNLTATFAGALGTAVCVPLLTLNVVGFPNGPTPYSKPVEVLKYGCGTALCAGFMFAGYRRTFIKDKTNKEKPAPAVTAPPPELG